MTLVESPLSPMQQAMNVEQEKGFIEKWDKELRKALATRMSFERQWYINLCFFSGKHWITLDRAGNMNGTRIIEPNAKRHQVRLVTNRVRLQVRRNLAKLNKQQIRGFVAAASSDDEDVAASRAAEKVNDYNIRQINLRNVFRKADFWSLICGTSFIKDYWDPEAFEPNGVIIDPNSGLPVQTEIRGRSRAEAITPFHFLVPNVDETDIDMQPWVAHVCIKGAKEVFDLYGVQVAEKPIANTLVESKLLAAQGINAQHQKAGVEVKEIWIAPCAEYPEGHVCVWSEQRILHQDVWQYKHKQYPFTRRVHIETGRFYGESDITDLIPLQVEYNKSRSQIIENKNRMARPQLLAQQGSINPRAITGEPGLVIEYKVGFNPPTPMPLQPLPSYVMDNVQLIKMEMDEIASQGKVTQGDVPPGVEAATAISYLQEEADLLISDILLDKEEAWQRVCTHLLTYAVQFWDAQRMIRAVGKSQNFEAFLLSQADLKDNTDFRVIIGSSIPESRAAMQAKIMELLKLGAIPPDIGLEYMAMPDLDKLTEELAIDKNQAQRENLHMTKGILTHTHDFDEHLRHIAVHDAFRKREEYENLDENAKFIFRAHVLSHMIQAVATTGFPVEQMNLGPDPYSVETAGQVLMVQPQIERILRVFLTQIQSGSTMPPNSGTPQEGQV